MFVKTAALHRRDDDRHAATGAHALDVEADLSGSAVRIELTGAADERGAIKLTEVANQANADTGADKTAKGALAIVEVDFYSAPTP
jgi:hypothetical protein